MSAPLDGCWGLAHVLRTLVLGLGFWLAITANAGAAPYLLDFTNPAPWAGANNQTTFSTVVGGVTVTLTAIGNNSPKMSFNSSTDERAGCQSGIAAGPMHGLTCGGDGIGIGDDDEITEGGVERLVVDFSRPVQVTNIELMDLFNNSSELERALISLNGGASFTQVTSNNALGGYYSTHLGSMSVARIIFKSYSDAVSDYAVARLSLVINPAPEPASAALLLLGTLALPRLRRRKA